MKFPFKKVGDGLSVDEYNALCYLLSKQEYSEEIILEFKAKHYKYGVYKLTDSSYSLVTKDKGFIIRKNTNPIKITFAHQNPNANFYIELKIFTYKQIAENGMDITLYPYDIIDSLEDNVMDSKYDITYDTIKLKAERVDRYTSVVNFIPQEYGLYPNDFIFADATMSMVYDEPNINYTDGREVDPNQIICEDFSDIQRAIVSAPPDSVLHLRLKGSETNSYRFPNQINIDYGKKVYIEGGNPYSENRSVLDGQNTNRLFIVQPNSTLSVKNCKFYRGNATTYPLYKTGGAITMSSSYENLGEYNGLNVSFVSVDNCIFEDCKAERGGAIYNHMGKLDVNDCAFNNCKATSTTNSAGAFGGAIMTTSVPVYNGASNQIAIDKSKYYSYHQGLIHSYISLNIKDTQNLNYFTNNDFTLNNFKLIYGNNQYDVTSVKSNDNQYEYKLYLPITMHIGSTFYLTFSNFTQQPSLCTRLLKVTGNVNTQMYVEMV